MSWKKIRKEELEKLFCKKYNTFEELERTVVPLLLDNKTIFENYYLKCNRELWDKFEFKILANNRKLKMIFLANLHLIQRHQSSEYSNLAYIVRAFNQKFKETEKI